MLYDGIPQPIATGCGGTRWCMSTGLVRGGFYASYDTYYVSMIYVLLVAMGCFVLGLALLRRHHRDLFERN